MPGVEEILRDDRQFGVGSRMPAQPGVHRGVGRNAGIGQAANIANADIELDVSVRYVGSLPNPGVPAYTAVDARLGWHARPHAELSVIAQNLFDPGHPEFGVPGTRSDIVRAVYTQILWHF